MSNILYVVHYRTHLYLFAGCDSQQRELGELYIDNGSSAEYFLSVTW